MAITGKVYVIPNAETRTWDLVVHNTGASALGVTQNVLPPGQPNMKVHDDHVMYGHGMPVNAGGVSRLSFHEGDQYSHQGAGSSLKVATGCHLRVGLRGLCEKTIELPDLDEGAPIELDLADFNWYGGNAETGQGARAGAHAGKRAHEANMANGATVLAHVQALIEAHSTHGIKCEGEATVTAVKHPDGQPSHWEVRFDNHGDQAWIGTCVFKRGQKNEGIGLESMGLPNKDSAAMQRIEYLGNYGVEATPGERIRLGVRGYAWAEVKLPADGEIKLPLNKFKLDTRGMADDYFDHEKVDRKRNEKRDKVQFFDKGKAINDSLEPKTIYGAEALALSDFDPPKLEVNAVKDGKDTPGGGWIVSLQSTLPEFDEKGRPGVVAAVKLVGADPQSDGAKTLGPKKLQYPGQTKSWFIPRGTDLGGVEAVSGGELQIVTRGLGWSATVALPRANSKVDSSKDDKVWGLREDQFNRNKLTSEFINRYRE